MNQPLRIVAVVDAILVIYIFGDFKIYMTWFGVDGSGEHAANLSLSNNLNSPYYFVSIITNHRSLLQYLMSYHYKDDLRIEIIEAASKLFLYRCQPNSQMLYKFKKCCPTHVYLYLTLEDLQNLYPFRKTTCYFDIFVSESVRLLENGIS